MIAVALAAVAALLTSFYVTSYKRHVQRSEDHVTVLVAKQDIPEGTPGADAAAHADSPLDVPEAQRRPGRDLQPGPDREPRRHPADAAGRAGHDPPVQPGRRERRQGRPEGHACAPSRSRATRTRPSPARSGRRPRRRRGHLQVPGPTRRPATRSSRAASCCATSRCSRRRTAPQRAASSRATCNSNFSVMLAVTDRQAQKLLFTVSRRAATERSGSGWSLAAPAGCPRGRQPGERHHAGLGPQGRAQLVAAPPLLRRLRRRTSDARRDTDRDSAPASAPASSSRATATGCRTSATRSRNHPEVELVGSSDAVIGGRRRR